MTRVAPRTDASGTLGRGRPPDPAGTTGPTAGTRSPRLNFRDGDRPAHLRAFYAWLPPDLHAAPGIDWTRLPSAVIGYLLHAVDNRTDAAFIALAVGAALGAMNERCLYRQAGHLCRLLRAMRETAGLTHPSELHETRVWAAWSTGTTLTTARAQQPATYALFSELYLRRYLEGLPEHAGAALRRYALPPAPAQFVRRTGDPGVLQAAAQQRRKERSDVLAPLHPLLVQLVQVRKQAAQRLVERFREERRQAEMGVLTLPHRFTHEDASPTVNRAARTVAEVQIVGRPVRMHFTLWDRRSWVLAHPERYTRETLRHAQQGTQAYAPASAQYFLQQEGPAEDLLWFGDLVHARLLQALRPDYAHTQERRDRARHLGATGGLTCTRPGVLTPGRDEGHWLALHHRAGDALFDPEALYRGVLYGAALSTIALTTASRVGELLQVSLDRFETIRVARLREGRPTGEHDTLYVQRLLPKGARTDEQRQFFLLSRQAVRLLKEIYEGLKAAHGGTVPVVQPSIDHANAEHLRPERYLFQWHTGPAGPAQRLGVLHIHDVSKLMRFMLHGLELSTARGEPIQVSTHLLRHVTATEARHVHHVPPEALAFLLHHRVPRSPFPQPSAALPAATRYYTEQPLDQRLALLHAFQTDLDEASAALSMMPPTERDLEQMNEDLRTVFERWGTILPTAFGYCGCPGLCIRGDERSLCIGCPYLVPDPARRPAAERWRRSYAQQAEELAAEGNLGDARQKRRLVRELDDLLNVMRLQVETETGGAYTPFVKTLPVLRPAAEVTHG